MLPDRDPIQNLSEAVDTSNVVEMVDLNEVVAKVLQPFRSSGRNRNVIVRCAQLPMTRASRECIEHVINELIRMMVSQPSEAKKFLHIYCEEEKSEETMNSETSRYRIQFQANMNSDENWKLLHQENILILQSMLKAHNAFLIVNEIITAGCLFSLSLPGK
jgi:light-regulated signal transduction histidine kinase (bacteriophytochrome)